MNHNIFIEGLQGTGKSTLADRLSQTYPECHVYREGDVSPVELAWCSYIPKVQYQNVCEQFPELSQQLQNLSVPEDDHIIIPYTRILTENYEFYDSLSNYEIYDARVDYQTFHDIIMKRYGNFSGTGNLFECSFFQNSIECMILFYEMTDDEIVDFYIEAFEILKAKNFRLIYLDTDEIKQNILKAKKERVDERGNEVWFSLITTYLQDSPYGKSHHLEGIDGLISHLEHRKALELRIMKEVIKEKALILQSKKYSYNDLIAFL